MKKVAILGVLGMAGHIMADYFAAVGSYEIYGIARNNGKYVSKQLEVTDFGAVKAYLDAIKPELVINCIGVLVQHSKDNIAAAILLNSYLPHFLAELGRKLEYKLIHISTDCVFSGKVGEYIESAVRDGDDNYARTKALGEVVNDFDLTIRTSIIGPELNPEGTGLLNWYFKQNGEINGFTHAFWSGVTTLELAKATHEFIHQEITGLYHLCPGTKISKYDLLRLFNQVWDKEIIINPKSSYIVDKSLVCTRRDFIYPELDYYTMLTELKRWMINNSDRYILNL